MPDQDFLRAAADMGSERVAAYQTFQDYYDGEHRTQLTERERTYLEAGGIAFAENFSETVVDVMCERLEVTGFDFGDKAGLSEHTDDGWNRNCMQDRQSVVHTQTAIKGDGFVIVDLDPLRRARYTWNPSDRVKVCYSDDSEEAEYAVKTWNTRATSFVNPKGDAITRMNIYYPDRIERYFTLTDQHAASTSWQAFVDTDENGFPMGWPVPWVDTAGNPLGIPVIHFKNKPLGARYGRSEIRPIIPQQDGLNKQVLDLFAVMDQQGWPQRHATGVDADTNLSVAVGEFLTTPSDTAKFGQFEAASPQGMLEAIEATLRRIAAKSRTPLHMLMMGGSLPSGETLKTAESPLVKKVNNRQASYGASWRDVVKMGLLLEQTFANLPQQFDPEEDMIEVRWEAAESRNETAFWEQQEAKLRAGVSKDTVLREAGYDPDEEKELRQTDQDEQREADEAFARKTAAGLDKVSEGVYDG